MSKILIPFSGGLDSTFLLYSALKNKEDVTPIYCNIKNNHDKVEREEQQRDKILKLLDEEFGTYLSGMNHPTMTFQTTTTNFNLLLTQPPIFLTSILYCLDESIKEVRIGYCMNDDAISFIPELKRIWGAFQGIYAYKLPKLTFPLMKRKKTEYWRELPNEIFQETYFCECPDCGEDCGRCFTCKRSIHEGLFYRYKRNKPRKSEGDEPMDDLAKAISEVEARAFVSS